MTAGFVFVEIKQKIMLMADSPSNLIMDTWWAQQQAAEDAKGGKMKLTDLQPKFLKRVGDERETWEEIDAITEADGVMFLCPKCFAAKGGPVGTHSVVCWKPHVPQTVDPKPGRWPMTGTGYADLTLTPSIQIPPPCSWHGFITNGEVT
jgi:hypothetical protein